MISDPDDDRVIVASHVHGAMTDVRGRYVISGADFELVTDGSVRSGGRGEAASSLDLLVASLVSCALNAFRYDLVPPGRPERSVEIFARVERDLTADSLGTLILECFFDDVDSITAEDLVDQYKRRCRIYAAVKDSLPIVFIPHVTRA
ncbi:OsmC family protein [Planctomonas sp. JC2975]|uniref:OsmC family protein n=1 Tax=Planctomonas sp. JC2975 TaxID=2729626 RepID=UPI0014766D9E|nr:OsmC family protein [Planctomonas sp. JC2975]NNC12093.1 OsmC family protein [Planctomonas sp. JC2975]